MKYHQLAAIDAVARAGGIRAAAKSLGITQGAVTKAIRELEAEAGEGLVIRSAQGASLTEAGRQLALRAQLVVAQMQAAQDDIAQRRAGAGGRLRIGLTPTFIETILPRIIARFQDRMPGVHLAIQEASLPGAISDLRDGTMDLAVVGAGKELAAGTDMACELLASVAKKVAVRHKHPLAGARSVRDVHEAVWVLTQRPDDPSDPMYALFADAGLAPPTRVVECPTLPAMVSIVASSDMISALPALVLRLPHNASRLIGLDLTEELQPSRYWLIRRSAVPLSPAGALMTDLLRRYSATLTEAS